MNKNYNLITEKQIENIKSTFNFTTDQQVYQWILKTYPEDVFCGSPEIMALIEEAAIQLGKIEIGTGVIDAWPEDYDFVFARTVYNYVKYLDSLAIKKGFGSDKQRCMVYRVLKKRRKSDD